MKDAKDVIKRKGRKETAGEVLARYRKSFELSQAALADLIGTTQNNISAIENGKREIGVNVARCIMIAANVVNGRFNL